MLAKCLEGELPQSSLDESMSPSRPEIIGAGTILSCSMLSGVLLALLIRSLLIGTLRMVNAVLLAAFTELAVSLTPSMPLICGTRGPLGLRLLGLSGFSRRLMF